MVLRITIAILLIIMVFHNAMVFLPCRRGLNARVCAYLCVVYTSMHHTASAAPMSRMTRHLRGSILARRNRHFRHAAPPVPTALFKRRAGARWGVRPTDVTHWLTCCALCLGACESCLWRMAPCWTLISTRCCAPAAAASNNGRRRHHRGKARSLRKGLRWWGTWGVMSWAGLLRARLLWAACMPCTP